MSDQTSSPGAAWRKIVSETEPHAFAAAFAADARLEMSASDEPIVGAMKLRAYFEASRTMFDRIEFTREITSGERTWLEWEGAFEGRPIAGATQVARNAVGAIESVRIYQRPFEQVVAFAAALSERLADRLGRHGAMNKQDKNKAIVLEAFDTLFNKRDYAAAQRFWSPGYIQHSAMIAPGREGVFALTRSLPETLVYEHGVIIAEGDFVMVHGRFSGNGQEAALVAVDIVRLEDEILVEHWDVLQSEATRATSASGSPMFGDSFAG